MKKYLNWIICTPLLVIFGFALFTLISIKSLSQQAPLSSPTSTPLINPSLVRPMPITVDPKISKQIYPCMVPKADQISLINKGEEVREIKLLDQIADRRKQTFYYLEVKTAKNDLDMTNNFFYPLIKLESNGQCESLHLEDVVAPFSYYIPLELARQLELKLIKQEITNAGGKDKYQQQLTDGNISGEGVILLSKEKEWALRQLGINIPPNSIIFNKPYSRSKGSLF